MKAYDQTSYSILSRACNVIDNVHVTNAFCYWNNARLTAMEFRLKGSYDKQNLTLVAILYFINFI